MSWLATLLTAAAAFAPPPADAQFDYQIGGPYPPPNGVQVVVRDWSVRPASDGYAVCYVNAFQSQPGIDWPEALVLRSLGDDPGWPGEYLIDLSTAARRRAAARFAGRMLRACARRGFDAVELDNLDSWTRLPDVPFGRRDALAYARLLSGRAHALGLAVGQKNTPQLTRREARPFDFAIAEACGRYRECDAYRRLHGDRVLAIEYRRRDFRAACRAVGDRIAVVLRDRDVSAPGSRTYRYDAC
jgi:hypothetical protein